jgi:hypothetical protein
MSDPLVEMEEMRKLFAEMQQSMEDNLKLVQQQTAVIKKQETRLRELEKGPVRLDPVSPMKQKYDNALAFAKIKAEEDEAKKLKMPLTVTVSSTAASSTTTISSTAASSISSASLTTVSLPATSGREKEPKILKLGTQLEPLTSEMKELDDWFNLFEMLVEPFNPTDSTLIVTLRSYLSKDIIIWLSTLLPENRNTYEILKYTIMFHYQANVNVDLVSMEKFISYLQGTDQSVNSFYAELLSKSRRLETIGQRVSASLFNSTFVRGLLIDIQRTVREKVNLNVDDSKVILSVALKVELDLAELKESMKVRNKASSNRSNTNRNNNNSENNSEVKSCINCSANSKGKEYCNNCFVKLKASGNLKCLKCRKNNNIPGFTECSSCGPGRRSPAHTPHNNNSNPPFNNNNNNNSLTDASKYVNQQVDYMKMDNSNNNPLFWNATKLKENKLCVYCSKSDQDHSGTRCSEKYKLYKSDEIRNLLINGLTPATRTKFPDGPRKWVTT